jgi:hypothetical protein
MYIYMDIFINIYTSTYSCRYLYIRLYVIYICINIQVVRTSNGWIQVLTSVGKIAKRSHELECAKNDIIQFYGKYLCMGIYIGIYVCVHTKMQIN